MCVALLALQVVFIFGYILDRYSKINVLALVFHISRSTYTLFAISFLFVKHEFHIEVGGHTVGLVRNIERQCTIKSNNHITSTLRPFQQCKMK